MTQDPRRERLEAVQPLSPRRVGGPRRDLFDDRQRERAEMPQIVPVAFEAGEARALRIVFRFALDLDQVFAVQTIEPPAPAIRIAADHGGLDDERFPLPRGAQGTVDYGGNVRRSNVRRAHVRRAHVRRAYVRRAFVWLADVLQDLIVRNGE